MMSAALLLQSMVQKCKKNDNSFLLRAAVIILTVSACCGWHCPSRQHTSADLDRILVVATCDTRTGWREFHALKTWNVTGRPLQQEGLLMTNVCRGKNWGQLGFLTKPLLYSQFLQSLLKERPHLTNKLHALLMDSDTFWSVRDIATMWERYDCARGSKNLVVSTEMSCWVGRYCNQTDIDRWYNQKQIDQSTSYSPFANSGVIMGKATEIVRMLDYIVVNNASYYAQYGRRYKFDDQYAVTDYALTVEPSSVALDYHQQISASCSVHSPGDPPDEGWPFLCKNRNGTLSFSCHIYNNLLRRQGHFAVDETSCMAYRKHTNGMVLQDEILSLHSQPLVWHGNGAGKRVCIDLGYDSFKCFMRKMNTTENDLLQEWMAST